MRFSQLVSVFQRTNVFYPIVAVAIIVPNLALGLYGYFAIRDAQQTAEEQVYGAYEVIVRDVSERIVAGIRSHEKKVSTEVPQEWLKDAAWRSATERLFDTLAPGSDQERLLRAADWALRHAKDLPAVRAYYLIDRRELVMPPMVARAIAAEAGEADGDAPGTTQPNGDGEGDPTNPGETAHPADAIPVDARTPPAEGSDSAPPAILAEALAMASPESVRTWHIFAEEVWPQLRTQLASVHSTRYVPIYVPARDEMEALVQFDPVTVGDRQMLGIAWLDLDWLEREVAQPLLDSVRMTAGQLALTKSIDARPVADDLLVAWPCSPAVVPHWWIAVRFPNGVAAYRHSSQVGATVNLALLAIFMPFIAVGAVLMIRALVKDIREARQKTDFVSRVTHELKTPLTSIRLFVETLQMGGAQSQEDVDRCLWIIQQESERLSKLIERVLDFSKMEMGNKVYNFRLDDIETVVRDTIDFFRKQAVQKGAVIRLYVERGLPRFSFDRDAVREVLLNLLENAIKYSVGDKLAAIRLTRTRWNNKEAVQIQVIDNGVGIRREDVSRIFDQFYRVDDTLTKGIDGSGLGLTLSREIARAHTGDILAESQPGRGSKFTLVLPLSGPRT